MAKKVVKKVDKKDLSKGLRALLSNNELEEKLAENQAEMVKELAHTFAMLPLNQIEANPEQPRKEFTEEALEELASSIKIHGLIQPITVRRLSPKEYQLISGERRLRASQIAGIEEVPAFIRVANDQELLEMALVENIQREELNAIEIAITYQRLLEECNLTHEKLAERVGKNRTSITNFLGLLRLPVEMQDAVKEKKISMGHARCLKGIDDLLLQKKLFNETINLKLSVRELENRIQNYRASKKTSKPPKSSIPHEYKNVRSTFRSFFGTKSVDLKLKEAGKGQIVIKFNSVDELNQLLDRIDE
jgi:ParB family chromosome partitioning protein